jgi:hypothetical protein
MRFEHLIEINDLNNPFIEVITHEQLWAGLVCRVEDPVPFLPGLESCEISARGENWVERILDFGPASIHDRVTLVPNESVHFAITPTETYAGGSLNIAIVAHSEIALFLRFTYETHHPASAEDEQYSDYVRSAYEQSDIDMVQRIRELASDGKLCPTLH